MICQSALGDNLILDIRQISCLRPIHLPDEPEKEEVMRLAGHAKYDTTLKYYLHVKDDLVDKARRAIKHKVSREMLERCLGRGDSLNP